MYSRKNRVFILYLCFMALMAIEHLFIDNNLIFLILLGLGIGSAWVVYSEEKIERRQEEVALNQASAESMIQAIDVPVVIINEQAEVVFENMIFKRLFHKKSRLDEELINYFTHMASNFSRIPRFLLIDFRTYRAVSTRITLENNTYFVTTLSDITEYMEGQNMQKRFVADASHELKTPLTSMKLTLELMREHPQMEESDRLDFIENLEKQTDRLMLLVQDLLTMSRLSHKRLPIRVESFSLNQVLNEIVFNHQQTILEKNLQVLLPSKDIVLYTDSLKITQILENLFINALNYTNEGHIRFISEKTEETVKIRVADSGEGISSTDLVHVFDRFYRSDRARSRDVGGTGLGLSIVKQLTEALGGNVRVSSELNSGTVFTVELPLVKLTEN